MGYIYSDLVRFYVAGHPEGAAGGRLCRCGIIMKILHLFEILVSVFENRQMIEFSHQINAFEKVQKGRLNA